MINQIIPIVEFGVKNDPSGEFLTLPVGDFSACFIDFFDNAGEDLESGFAHSFGRPVAGVGDGNQQCSAFRLADSVAFIKRIKDMSSILL